MSDIQNDQHSALAEAYRRTVDIHPELAALFEDAWFYFNVSPHASVVDTVRSGLMITAAEGFNG